jgi:RNA polymerase sigma-70 factor (ECF subfamily)
MTESDLTLVAGLKAGDQASFAMLVRSYSGRLIATATRILGSECDAQDAVQDGLVSAWQGIGEFRQRSGLYTWLHRITVNACLARMRTAQFRNERAISGDSDGIDTDAISRAFEVLPSAWSASGPSLEKRMAMRRSLQRALDRIPEELRTVLILRDVEELSSQEVATNLGITDAAVRQRLHRARSAMAELLRPELCDGPALTCGGQVDLLLDYLDRSLTAHQRTAVKEHIASCDACETLLGTYRMTVALPRTILELGSPPEIREGWVDDTVLRGVSDTFRQD